MTILLGDDHQMVWYWGLMEKPIEGPKVSNFGKEGIGLSLRDKMKKIANKEQGVSGNLMVIIRPSNRSTYGDFVKILDEMAINGIRQYAVADISSDELKLLTKWGL